MSEGVISALIGALSGVIAAYLTLRVNMQRNKIEAPKLYADADLTNAEASSKLNGISLAMVQSYKDEVNRLYNEIGTMRERLGQMECRVNDLEDEIQNKERRFADLLSGAHVLYNQLANHAIKPDYTPPERREGD